MYHFSPAPSGHLSPRRAGRTRPPLAAYSTGAARPGARRLHLNEFRFDHPPEVVEALRGALAAVPVEELLVRYQAGPDDALARDLARYVGAPSERNILVAPGSDEVLRAVLDTCGHRSVLVGIPGYTHFEHNARLRGLEIVAYPIGLATPARDHEAALRYYADLLEAGCLVYLGSPNNPTGDLWSAASVAALAAEYPRSLFLVDEAYVEFVPFASGAWADDPGDYTGATYPDPEDLAALEFEVHADALNAESLVPVALARDNVVVARTMSKAFGLAALRVGYAVGTERAIELLGVAVSPKAANPLAARVARAALGCLGHYRRAAAAACREARRVVEELRGRGWWALGTPGNFYLVYVGDAGAAVARLAELGVQVRDRGALPGLSGFARLTAGSADDSAAVIAAFAQLSPPPSPPPQALYTPKGVVAAIKTLTKRTLAVLAAASVEVWAQGGTMLGMSRHRSELVPGGLVPWDDDVDLAYLLPAGAPDPLAALVPAFRGAGLTLQRNRTGAYYQAGTNAPGEVISAVHVDLFSYSAAGEPGPDGKPVYVLGDPRFRDEDPASPQAHCNTRYAHDELFPLTAAYRFYDLPIPMPAQAEAVLRRALGADYATTARVRTDAGLATFALRDATPA
jgi:histidinol-phosphate aminotransferase